MAETNRKRMLRLISVIAPAAAITAGLFFAMQNLIETDEFEATALRVYHVLPYVEQETPEADIPPSRKPHRLDTISTPPSPPKLISTIKTPGLPISLYVGAAPADYGEATLDGLRPTGAGMAIDRGILPISPPIPNYPSNAIRQTLEGYCDVHLKVSPKGHPFDVYAICSHPVLKNAAKRSIEKVRFAPQIRDGLPVTVTGVVYPLEFRVKQ